MIYIPISFLFFFFEDCYYFIIKRLCLYVYWFNLNIIKYYLRKYFEIQN